MLLLHACAPFQFQVNQEKDPFFVLTVNPE